MHRADWRWFWAILGLAAVLRLGYFVGHSKTVFAWQPVVDAHYHYVAAQHFAERDPIIGSGAFHPPLYTSMLGIFYRALDESVRLPFTYLLNHLFGVGGVALTFLAAFHVAGRWPAVVAALLVSTCGPFVAFGNDVLPETLIALFIVAMLYLLILAVDSKGADYPFWAGCVFALCAQTFPGVYFFLPMILLRLVTLPPSRRPAGPPYRPFEEGASLYFGRWMAPVTFALPLLLGPIFYGVVTQAQTGHFAPFPARGGVYFHLGNGDGADGMSLRRGRSLIENVNEPLDPVHAYAVEEYRRRHISPDDEYLDEGPSPLKLSAFWAKETLDDIASQPFAWISLISKKAILTFNHHSSADHTSYAFDRQINPFARWWPPTFGLIVVLGLVGVWPSAKSTWAWPRHWLWLFALCHVVCLTLFFVNARARAPMTPVLSIMAGLGVVRLWRLAGRKSRRRSLFRFASPSLIAFSVLVFVDWFNVAGANVGRDWWRYAWAAYRSDQWNIAARACDRAIELGEGHPLLYVYRGRLYMDQGKARHAEKYYRLAILAQPEFARPYYEIGRHYMERGEHLKGVSYLKAAVLHGPDEPEFLAALGMAAMRARDRDGQPRPADEALAFEVLQRAIAWDPHNLELLVALGEYELRQGNEKAANRRLERARDIDYAESRRIQALLGEHIDVDVANTPAFSILKQTEEDSPSVGEPTDERLPI